MNILLTGSGGFIGSNLKSFLQLDYNLLTPRSFDLDLTDRNAVQDFFCKNDIDFIIHCATVGGVRGQADSNTTVEDNLSMVNNLLEFKRYDTRIILFGSGAMYGKDRNLHKVNESNIGKYMPKDLYGQSKMQIANLIKNRDDVLCLNIFACYGYGENESRFPSYAILQHLKKLPIIINQNVVFDYLWVEDMQRIVQYFIKNKPSDSIINITPENSVTLLEIAEIVNGFSGFKSEIVIKNPVMNFEYTGDNTVLLKNFPDFCFTNMKTGLLKLYNYIEKTQIIW